MTVIKKIFLLVLLPLLGFAQIPNPGFENWTDGNPDGWSTTNVPGFTVPVTQSTDAHSGSSAVRMEVISFMENTYAGVLFSGTGEQLLFPVSQNYQSVRGYYKFHQENALDNVFATVSVYSNEDTTIGSGAIFIDMEQTTYAVFEIPIVYFDQQHDATLMLISFVNTSLNPDLTTGTYLQLDDLSLSMVTALEEPLSAIPQQFSLQQNFPNPFNPVTRINYQLAVDSKVNLSIYNMLGQKIATLVSKNQQAGAYSLQWDAAAFSSGVYFYRLETDQGFVDTKRLILLK